MQPAPVSRLELAVALAVSLCVIAAVLIRHIGTMPFVVFCDVGQGDGAYVRLNGGFDLLIDTGPDNSRMLDCIGRHQPFYDRTIELIILSHPQADHMGSYRKIAKRYTVLRTVSLPGTSGTSGVRIPVAQDTLHVPGGTIVFLAPKPYRMLLPSKQENDFCFIVELRARNTRILFTADASITLLDSLTIEPFSGKTILKYPHHGSKTSISTRLLRLAHPSLTVISVGKRNRYGHPARETLEALKAFHVPVRRTDLEGDIVLGLQ
jgi:competence protein ComEC